MEKFVKVLDSATDLLAEAIRSGADRVCPQVCEAQEILLDLLISLNPSYGLE